MRTKLAVYNYLPDPLKPFVKRGYYTLLNRQRASKLHAEFVENFFSSRSEYERYVKEFDQGPAAELLKEGLEKFRQMTGGESLFGVGLDTARDYYAIVRKRKPSIVVETGVCNGVSTLAMLLAIRENGAGKLYSIDYPMKAEESLDEFREETFRGYGGAAIPSDREPGWIIPDELRSPWELIIGKSQRELPQLLTELETLDVFVHDSEHSHPCMMFEFELAYEWLDDDGVILSDDISWNSAFSVFTEIREAKYGKLSNNVGYIQKETGN